MHVYWSFQRLPGLEAVPRADRRRVFLAAVERHVGFGQRLLYPLPALLIGVIGPWVLIPVLGLTFLLALVLGLAAGIAFFLGTQMLFHAVIPYLPQTIVDLDERLNG